MLASFRSTCRTCHNDIRPGQRIERGSSGTFVHAACLFAPQPASAFRPGRTFEIATSRWSRPDDDELSSLAPEGMRPAPARPTIDADDASYDAWLSAPLSEADYGPYVSRTDDTLIYSVRSAKGDDGRTYYFGQKWTLETAGDVGKGRFQTKDANGEGWTQRIRRWIRAGKLRKMTEEEARAFCVRYGWCPVHNGPLSNADSVDAGVGPICAERMGWDRKALAEATRASRRAAIKASTPARSYADLFGDDDDTPPPAVQFDAMGNEVSAAPVATAALVDVPSITEAMPAAFVATPQAARNAAKREAMIERQRAAAKARRGGYAF